MPEMILQIQSISFQLCISPSALTSPFIFQSHHTSSLGIIYSFPNTISVLPFLFSSLQRGKGKGSAHSHYGNYDTSSHSPLGNDTHSLSQIAYYFYTYVSSHSTLHHLKSGTYNRLIPPSAESLSLLLYTVLVKLELEVEEGELHRLQGQNLCFEPC
jgi:hypothetical protein